MTLMDQVKIILVEPAGERNIGSIARVMCNMNLHNLVIVNPQCDHLSEDARIMAVHGVEVLHKAVIVDSLPMALHGCQRAIATTGRNRGIPTTLETPRKALPWLIEGNVTSGLIFGPEDRGLSNEELSYAQRFVRIPSNAQYPSLNLAQAVGICVYELYQGLNSIAVNEKDDEITANIEDLERYYQHLESVLLDVNYLYPHTASVKMQKLRTIINRTNLNTQELAMIRGILRQIQWAIKG